MARASYVVTVLVTVDFEGAVENVPNGDQVREAVEMELSERLMDNPKVDAKGHSFSGVQVQAVD